MLAVFAWPVVSMLAELDERSDTANIPLVIPPVRLPLGLLLMALFDRRETVALPGRAAPVPHRVKLPGTRGGSESASMSATFVYFILPAVLLILGLPIFVVLTLTSTAAIRSSRT